MNLLHAFRFDISSTTNPVISLAGAGGKTSTMFKMAREFLKAKKQKVLVTTTTHLGVNQASLADHHFVDNNVRSLQEKIELASGVILITSEVNGEKLSQTSDKTLHWLREYSSRQKLPLLIEADGSRRRPIKAPAEHEPAIPDFSNTTVYITGLSAIGKPLNSEHVHRPEIFSKLSNLQLEHTITAEAISNVLKHPQGGLKNVPPAARRIAFLNQADSPELQSIGGGIARKLLNDFDSVIVGSLQKDSFQTIEHTAGIILAAGKSTRFGSPKQLLDWKGKPFVRQVAETALQAGLWPVAVVTGAHHVEIESALNGLPIEIIHNPNFEEGQSTSIRTGLQKLPSKTGSAIFLLADQPQIPVEIVRALTESHSRELQPILAPLVLEERRANPVLFDKVTFPDLMQLTGDIGGRGIFDRHKVEYLPWHDDILLFDVDKPEDYERLKGLE